MAINITVINSTVEKIITKGNKIKLYYNDIIISIRNLEEIKYTIEEYDLPIYVYDTTPEILNVINMYAEERNIINCNKSIMYYSNNELYFSDIFYELAKIYIDRIKDYDIYIIRINNTYIYIHGHQMDKSFGKVNYDVDLINIIREYNNGKNIKCIAERLMADIDKSKMNKVICYDKSTIYKLSKCKKYINNIINKQKNKRYDFMHIINHKL